MSVQRPPRRARASAQGQTGGPPARPSTRDTRTAPRGAARPQARDAMPPTRGEAPRARGPAAPAHGDPRSRGPADPAGRAGPRRADDRATAVPAPDTAPGTTPGTAPGPGRARARAAGRGAAAPAEPLTVQLRGEFITLDALLKVAGVADSGGAAKAMVAAGQVCVDGVQESRKTAKIRAGQRIEVGGITIVARAADDAGA